VAWVIEQYRAVKLSSQVIYARQFTYLNDNFGTAIFASFTERNVRAIRNKLADAPSIAGKVVDMIGRLWRFAKEHLEMNLGANPAAEVAAIHTERQPHKAWPPELCAAIEKHKNPKAVRAYYLLRYTGQRR
jgi:hypothetical protein